MALQLCGTSAGNTGLIRCAGSPGKILSLSIFNGVIAPADYQTLSARKTKLVALSKLSKDDANKLFLLPLHINKENKKENNQETTFSNGLKVVTREGAPGWRFSFYSNTAQNKQLRKFNGSIVRVLINDDKKRIWGSMDADDNLIGREAQIFFEGLDHIGDDGVEGMAYVTISFIDAAENFDDAVFIDVDFNPQNVLAKLLDVQIYEKADSADNVFNLSGKIDTANAAAPLDIYSDYSTTLFNTASLWHARVVSTGNSISVTSMASNAGGYGVLTLNSAAWGALDPGTEVEIYTSDPTALDTANAKGIETVSLIVTVPA